MQKSIISKTIASGLFIRISTEIILNNTQEYGCQNLLYTNWTNFTYNMLQKHNNFLTNIGEQGERVMEKIFLILIIFFLYIQSQTIQKIGQQHLSNLNQQSLNCFPFLFIFFPTSTFFVLQISQFVFLSLFLHDFISIFIILLFDQGGPKNVASKYQQQFKVQMQQRKRLTRANRKPLDSFDQTPLDDSGPCNLLKSIQNNNLYLKLVGIALEMSREAGVSQLSLEEVQKKLLAFKGFQEYSMLNQNRKSQLLKQDTVKQKLSYNPSKKYITPQEQLAFLNRMDRQVREVQTKEHIIQALKKYIEQKKKTLYDHSARVQNNTRAKVFIEKIKGRRSKKNIQRSNYYGQTIRQIFGRITPRKSIYYEILRKMAHLKTIWGHTFFSQAQQEYCPVYNVIFDKSQRMILSGGQDGKIKVWNRDTGGLISTLQGHKDFINKIGITKDNKIILSAANDGVRFFDLGNMQCLTGFQIQNIMDIGQVHDKEQNSSIIFANSKKLYVIEKQRIWSERHRRLECYDFKIYNFGSRLKQNTLNTNTITITAKGFVFLGFIQGQIIIFDFNQLHEAEFDTENYGIVEGMDIIPEFLLPIHFVLNAHEGDIIQITWNALLSVFCTGAKKDGVCKIWQYNLQQPSVRPEMIKEIKIPKHKTKRKRRIYNCNFCSWNSTFTHLACSFEEQQIQEQLDYRGDGEVVVYNAIKQQTTWQISKSIELSSIRALDSHPFLPNIMLICDSYGKVMIVDIFQNFILNLFEERAFHLGHPAFCLVPSQCRFSQDGMNFVVATEYGNCSIYGYDIKQFYHLYPTEQLLTNDYKQITIDPITFKPHLQDGTILDSKAEQYQQLENMKHNAYKNYRRINPAGFKKQINNQTPKEKHENKYQLSTQQIERMGECYLQYERNQQFLKNNIEEIQSKRMSLLYDERIARQENIKAVINEKITRIKELDGFSASFETNNLLSIQNPTITTNSNQSPYFSQVQQPVTRQGRGRRATRNQTAINARINNYNTQIDSESEQNIQQLNKGEANQSSFSAVQSSQNEYDQCSLASEDSYQDISYEADHRLRRRNGNNRRVRATQNTRLRRNPKRPACQQIQELQKAYDQQYGAKPKKRTFEVHQGQEDNQAVQQQAKKQFRRVASRSLAQMRHQRASCTLCLFKEAAVSCYSCQHKKFCDGCRNYRGKKIPDSNRYICFQCYYDKNLSPQVHRNLSFQKYIMSQRTDLFVPQIGDQVVYFFQGYQQFLYDKIESLNNKYIQLGLKFDIVPHENNPQLINIQKCIVMDISYAFPLQEENQLIYKNTMNRVRGRQNKTNSQQDILAFITLKAQNGHEFRVFHFPGYQFLLKWEIYNDITQNQRYGKFKLFDIVKIKQEQIQIMEIRPLNSNYNNSIWKNIIVHKAQNKYLRRNRDKNDDIAVNIWNIDGFIDPKSLEYTKCMNAKSREHYKNEIQKIRLNQPKMWEIFSQFVDTDIYTMYNQYVEVSMCLTLILERLQKNYYSSEESFIKDIKMLTQNSIIFNSKQSEITQLSERMVKMILEGQNYNHDNEVDQTTQKKGRIKRKFNSGSSGRQADEQQKNKKKEIKVSKFTDDMIDIGNKYLPLTKKNRYKQQSQEQDYKESQSNYDSQSSSIKPITRSKRRVENNTTKSAKSQSCRITRSRNKN